MQTVKLREERYEKKPWQRAKSWGRQSGNGTETQEEREEKTVGGGERGKVFVEGADGRGHHFSWIGFFLPLMKYTTLIYSWASRSVSTLFVHVFLGSSTAQTGCVIYKHPVKARKGKTLCDRVRHAVKCTCALGQGNAVQCKVKQIIKKKWTLICTILCSVWQIYPI